MRDSSVVTSIVIPVYNSSDSLKIILERVLAVFKDKVREPCELIFVDDCSHNPDTWPLLVSLAENYGEVRALQLTRNFGRTGAVLAGINDSRGRYIVIMDDDLQHRPEDIPLLLAERGHDVVLAQFGEKAHGAVARLGSRVTTLVEHVALGLPKSLKNSAFILIRREIAENMLLMHTPNPFIPALLLEVTKDIVGVDAAHDQRYSGKTQYSFFRRLRHFSDLIINNSAILLRGVATVGIFMSIISFAYGCYLLWRGPASVPGWASLMVVTLIIGGLVLMSLGITGEYLIRIIRGIESRPAYILRKKIGYPSGSGSRLPNDA